MNCWLFSLFYSTEHAVSSTFVQYARLCAAPFDIRSMTRLVDSSPSQVELYFMNELVCHDTAGYTYCTTDMPSPLYFVAATHALNVVSVLSQTWRNEGMCAKMYVCVDHKKLNICQKSIYIRRNMRSMLGGGGLDGQRENMKSGQCHNEWEREREIRERAQRAVVVTMMMFLVIKHERRWKWENFTIIFRLRAI